ALLHRQINVALLHAVGAVDRDEEFRLGVLDHLGVFVLASVPGNVQRADLVEIVLRCSNTCTPFLVRSSTIWPMSASLPLSGIGVLLKITVSWSLSFTCLCSPLAIRCSALLGSPWLPVHTTTISWSFMVAALAIGTNVPLGIFMKPLRTAISSVL